MRIDYHMSSGSSIDIEESDLVGMTEKQKRDYINEMVSAAAYEEVDSSLDWDIVEE
jgi:hypothetical protein